MDNPYINTKLPANILLRPDQMDNKFYINLKRNLEYKLLKRCYNEYGYIVEIFEILNYKKGIIEAENPTAAASFDLDFSCRLCKPIKNQTILCQIDHVSKVLVTASNGPILVIITNDRINDELFFTDNNNNIRYKKPGGGSKVLEPKDFIKVTIISVVFNHGDDKIKTMGLLTNMASEEEIKKYYQESYTKDKQNIVDIGTLHAPTEEEEVKKKST
jgi:DNA-directed RNA polymerase subunit E'/Rpb7